LSDSESSQILKLQKTLEKIHQSLQTSQDVTCKIMQEHLKEMTRLTDNISRSIDPSVPDKYFSTEELAISIATPVKPSSSDIIANAAAGIPGYDRLRIYEIMNRNSPNISVINDGTASLYVIISHDGYVWSTDENPILVGEARLFHNVYELRIRSPVAGNVSLFSGGVYRATEYDYWLAYSRAVASALINRSAFIAQSIGPIAAPGIGGTNLPNIAIPNGFQLVVRATPGNAANVFLATSAVNINNAASRITLAVGDTAKLQITNANLVWVASAGVANVDILAEQ
jgi:hypothetical protein